MKTSSKVGIGLYVLLLALKYNLPTKAWNILKQLLNSNDSTVKQSFLEEILSEINFLKLDENSRKLSKQFAFFL